MKSELQKLVDLFKNYKVGFVSIKGYTNRYGEVTNRTINVGFSYENLKKSDLNTLTEGVDYVESERYTRTDWESAIAELKNSAINPDVNKSRGQKEAYIKLTPSGSVRYGVNTEKIYIDGLLLEGTKEVLQEGNYPTVNSRPKTIAKNTIKKEYLKQSKINRFIYTEIGNLKMNGETLEIS